MDSPEGIRANIDRQIIGDPELKEKLQLLRQALNRMHLPFRDKRQIEEAAAGLLLRGEDNLSRHYRKMNRATKDASLARAPAYHTRRQDGVFYPTMDTFNSAYNIIEMGSLPSKMKETAFQILNRTIWTNKKAYKLGRRDNPNCDNCNQTETIESLIYGCKEYSADLWIELGQSLTHVIIAHTGKAIPTIQFIPLEIIYNKTHPSVKLHIKEKPIQSIVAHLMQEIK
jgi:hypothetical protein